MDLEQPRQGASSISLFALFGKFLRFGFLAFGGPVAQIAMVRKVLIEDEGWTSSARFNKLLAVLQILPGPEAHELCVHLGILARGRIGGLLAGLGFMLPGFLFMLVAGWIYVTWVSQDQIWTGPLLGIQIAVIAVIVRAIFRIGEHILVDGLTWAIAIGSALVSLLGTPFWLPLVAAGAIYALSHRPVLAFSVAAITTCTALYLYSIPSDLDSSILSHTQTNNLALFIAGLKGGLLTFGGAYTAIPYVRADTVERGWLSDATFLDGIAIAGLLPAPLVIFATFVGYVVGGLSGALAITAGIFLPAFAFSMIFYERLEAIVDHPALQRVLEGVAAAVVGIIGATVVQLAKAASLNISTPISAFILFSLVSVAAWRLKGGWVTAAIVAVGASWGLSLPL